VPYHPIDRRKYQRYDFCSKIDYMITPGDPQEIFKGVTVNISHSGLRLYMFMPHHEGQGIRIKTKLPEDIQTATIRWIKRSDGNLYEAGLQYSQSINAQ